MTTADDEKTVKNLLFAEGEKLDLKNDNHVRWVLGGLEFASIALAIQNPDLLRVSLESVIARIDGDEEKYKAIGAKLNSIAESLPKLDEDAKAPVL